MQRLAQLKYITARGILEAERFTHLAKGMMGSMIMAIIIIAIAAIVIFVILSGGLPALAVTLLTLQEASVLISFTATAVLAVVFAPIGRALATLKRSLSDREVQDYCHLLRHGIFAQCRRISDKSLEDLFALRVINENMKNTIQALRGRTAQEWYQYRDQMIHYLPY